MKYSLKILILFALTIMAINCTFKQQRIRLYDNNTRHFVFGGGSVVSSYGKFQYEEIKEMLEAMVQKKECRVVSISLLSGFSSPKEVKEGYIEQNFYNEHYGRPNQAVINRLPSYYHNFPIYGSFISPTLIPSFLLGKAAKYHKYVRIDNLESIFHAIDVEMGYKNVDSVILVHSMEGFDRVSYVMGVYQMKYQNKEFKDVMKEILMFYKKNKKDEGLSWRFYNGLQWFCLQLGRSANDCLIGSDGNNPKSYEL